MSVAVRWSPLSVMTGRVGACEVEWRCRVASTATLTAARAVGCSVDEAKTWTRKQFQVLKSGTRTGSNRVHRCYFGGRDTRGNIAGVISAIFRISVPTSNVRNVSPLAKVAAPCPNTTSLHQLSSTFINFTQKFYSAYPTPPTRNH